jgi:IS5 family transposase
MLRIHFLQSWSNLSDPEAEKALYDMESMRRFVGIDIGNEPVPDETAICKFRHLLEAHGLGGRIFHKVDACLEEKGLRLSEGTIMDATIITPPPPRRIGTRRGTRTCSPRIRGTSITSA